MSLVINTLLLLFGFVLLIKGADYFVEGASGIADRFHIPQVVIGLTIVAFGTSAPEAAISIAAGLKGSAGIAVGNIIGSNILNILLILGLSSSILPLKVPKDTIRFEIPFVFAITAILVVIGGLKGELSMKTGVLLWGLFLIFFLYLIWTVKQESGQAQVITQEEKRDSIIKLIAMTLIGLAAIVIGSDLAVDNASELASYFGLSDRLIGLTIVAFGTSLPELITSVTAAKKGKDDIAIGNIVGSNIFNILFVLGTTALITPIPYVKQFIVDGVVAVISVALLWAAVRKNGILKRNHGLMMLGAYFVYFIYLCFI